MHSARTCVGDEEGRYDAVSYPHADPCLPPAKATCDHGGDDHPCVDVEAVCDPECYKVPVLPCALVRLDREQVVILCEGVSQSGLSKVRIRADIPARRAESV